MRFGTPTGDRRHVRKDPELAPGSLSEGVRVTVVSAFHRSEVERPPRWTASGRKIWLIVTDIKSPDAHEAPGLFQVKEKTLAHQEPAS